MKEACRVLVCCVGTIFGVILGIVVCMPSPFETFETTCPDSMLFGMYRSGQTDKCVYRCHFVGYSHDGSFFETCIPIDAFGDVWASNTRGVLLVLGFNFTCVTVIDYTNVDYTSGDFFTATMSIGKNPVSQ